MPLVFYFNEPTRVSKIEFQIQDSMFVYWYRVRVDGVVVDISTTRMDERERVVINLDVVGQEFQLVFMTGFSDVTMLKYIFA